MIEDSPHLLPKGACRWDAGRTIFLVSAAIIEMGLCRDGEEAFQIFNGRELGADEVVVVLKSLEHCGSGPDKDQYNLSSGVDIEKPPDDLPDLHLPASLPPVDFSMDNKHPELQMRAAERQRDRLLGREKLPPTGRISVQQFTDQGCQLLPGQIGVDLREVEERTTRRTGRD